MRLYSDAELDLQGSVCQSIMREMDRVDDYEMLVGIISAHVQRMICDQSRSEDEKFRLLAEFNAACFVKVKWHADVASGRAQQSPTEAKKLLAEMADKFQAAA